MTERRRRRAQGPSPPAFIDELFDRNVQGLAFAEPLEPLDRLAPTIRTGPPDRHKACDRPAMLCDRELFAPSDPLKQSRQMRLGLVGADIRGHLFSDRSETGLISDNCRPRSRREASRRNAPGRPSGWSGGFPPCRYERYSAAFSAVPNLG